MELSQQECEILQRNIAVEDAKTKLVDFKPKEAGEVSLEDAEVVVAAGRGIKKNSGALPRPGVTVRWYGKGGQGAVTASKLLATSALVQFLLFVL